jgi:hypothetical protein
LKNKTIGLRTERKSEKEDGQQKEGKNDKWRKWSEMTMVNKKIEGKNLTAQRGWR